MRATTSIMATHPTARAAGDVGIDHRHHSFVLGISSCQTHDRSGVTRVVAPVILVEVADDTRNRSVIVVILLRSESTDDKITAVKHTEPRSFVRTEKFLVFEEFSLQKKCGRISEGADEYSRIGGGNDRPCVLRHRAPLPVANSPLKNFSG